MSFFDIFKQNPLSLHDVELKVSRANAMRSPIDLRGKVDIIAIDDNEFHPEANLRGVGFNIKSIRDINSISDVEAFSIILCDLNGVGTALSTETQGAYVIEEIKKTYPEKIVIAYTANPLSSKLARRASIYADDHVKKDETIEEWRDLLDSHIKDLTNPIGVWKKLRLRLLDKGIELNDLIRLEQIVLKSINAGTPITRTELEKALKTENSSAPWKTDLAKFIGSKAFDLAFSVAIS